MEHLRVALAANLNRAAQTLERLAGRGDAEPTAVERLEEMQAHVDAGAALWGAVNRGFLTVPEIVERVDELTEAGYLEPDSLVGSGQESAQLFLGVMTDFVYPLGEATTPTYAICDEWEPTDCARVMYRRNELRSESTGCRLLARLIETGDLDTTAGAAKMTTPGPVGDGPWVPAGTLWHDKFSTNRELTRFREQHPEMFHNPSTYKLEIHAARWAKYWAEHDKAGFDSLDGDAPSVADDPDIQSDAIAEALQRAAALRQKKQTGKT